MAQNFFKQMTALSQAQTRVVEALGVPYTDPFNEEAVIADVNDPKELGRVKVTTSNDFTSDWITVAGSSRGRLSARYIGAKVLVGKVNGRSEEMYVIGLIRTDPEIGMVGSPIQLPIIDESMGVWGGSKDSGMQCNKGNEGRLYVLSSEMNQDVVVCLRRNNLQLGSDPSWAWKSLSSGLWVEKGVNPGNASTNVIEQAQERNPGIPACTESLLGEVHEFTEERGFRTTTLVCRRGENKDFSWMPISAPPTFFRTTLPKCTEKIHGFEAVLDDGNNSEFMVCQRYQGLMKWVRHGDRIPHKFYKNEKPLSRIDFVSSFNPIPALEEVDPTEWLDNKDVQTTVLDTFIQNIPLTGTDEGIKELLKVAGLVPSSAFDGADVLSKVARAAINKRTGVPVDTIVDIIKTESNQDGSIPRASQELISGIGESFDTLVNGVKEGNVEGALQEIGKDSLVRVVNALDSKAGSVMSGLITGGVIGAVDTAVAVGLDQLPPEVNKYVKPVVDVASQILTSKYPNSVGNLLNAAVGGGLTSQVSSLINTAAKRNIVTPQLVGSLTKVLKSGALGPVSQVFNAVSNLEVIPKIDLGSLGSLPRLATTALGVVGQSQALLGALGKGGIGIEGFDKLIGGGFSSATALISGIKGLGGLFGGKKAACPCDPKCRKTSHGEDSDGNNLLEKCGALTANNANSFSPTGNPLLNNIGPIAELQNLLDTAVGSELLPSNIRDLSLAIKGVQRIGNMAEKFYASRFADKTEKEAEVAYTFEAVEKSLKIADNNITRVESVERKLIDTMYNVIGTLAYSKEGKPGVVSDLIRDVRENAQALRDLYKFVKKLDSIKSGGKAGVRVTGNLAKSFGNIPSLSKLSALNKKEALRILSKGVIPADAEWRSMAPGLGAASTLGQFSDTLPDPYDNEVTLFDKNRILSISAESKLDDSDPEEDVMDVSLSKNQLDTMKSQPDSLYDSILDREGKSNCE